MGQDGTEAGDQVKGCEVGTLQDIAPSRTVTPETPKPIPAILCSASRSSVRNRCATMMAKIGVVPFRIEASPLGIIVWAQNSSLP